MSLKRTWIGVRYWLTKRWRMFYCCLALTCFAFILLTSSISREPTGYAPIASTISLRHSLTASGEQPPAARSEWSSNFSIATQLNSMIRDSWSKLNGYYANYYTKYYTNYAKSKQPEDDLLTLFSSSKFKKFNEIDYYTLSQQPALQLNISDQLKSQLDLVVRRVIAYHESIYDVKRINRNNLTVNLIRQMLDRQAESRRPLTISYTDQWQPVIGPKEKSRVYSAYYESRLENGKFVRVIGAARTNHLEPLFCAHWHLDNHPLGHPDNYRLRLTMTPAINRVIRENWNLKYSAYYLLCPLAEHGEVPVAVSILKRKQQPKKSENDEENELNAKESDELVLHALGNFVLVQNNLKHKQGNEENVEESPEKNRMALCVKPLHYDYNKLDNLIEFIELNTILGIDHFLFYNHTVGPKVDCLLRHYATTTDRITVLPWHRLDMKSQQEIRTEGIFASLNDCLYRTMYRFKYVAMIDLDEFLIPHQDDDLKVLLSRLTSLPLAKNRAGAFSFQNAFFYLQWPDDPKYSQLSGVPTANHLPVYLTTLAKSRRKAIAHSHRQRSKLILLPDATVEVGNHFVSNSSPDAGEFISEKFRRKPLLTSYKLLASC